MTTEDEILDLQNRILEQSKRHKTRSGLYHKLCKIRLSELEDEMSSKHAVDQAVYALRMAIYDLQNLRMSNDTADQLLMEHATIAIAAHWLNEISKDISASVHKAAAE